MAKIDTPRTGRRAESTDGAEDVQIGRRLRELRHERGLSMKEVAARLDGGVHFTTIAKLETGRMRLTYEWLDRLITLYGVELSEFASIHTGDPEPRLIPVFDGSSWPPASDKPWPQLGVLPVLDCPPLAFAVEHFDGVPDLASEIPFFTVVIDPDDKSLMEGAVYAYVGNSFLNIGVYRGQPSRLVPYLSRLSLIAELDAGQPDRVEIIGRVLSVHRRYDSGIS